jgi:putative exosortase-associated protein (TIGR04073 family)
MKTFLTVAFLCAFALALHADIQDPPSNDHGPTRKLGRGVSNLVFGWSEIYPTVAKVNTDHGNSAAAGYGVVRGVGRGCARFGVGLFEVLTFPFPLNRGTYMPVLPSDVRYIHAGYSEFPTELGNESKYPYVRYY